MEPLTFIERLKLIWTGAKWKLLFACACVLALLFCCLWLSKPQEVITVPGSQAVTIYKDRVVLKDRIIYKPVEGGVAIGGDGLLVIQQKGFCFVPKVGFMLVPGESPRAYVGARLAFWHRMGIEAGANDKRALMGIDARIPWLQSLMISGGATSKWADLTGVGIYGAVGIALK
jgi:hypothetical protein